MRANPATRALVEMADLLPYQDAERGLPMEKSVQKNTLTSEEKLLIRLHEYARFHETESIRQVCKSLVAWYQRHGFWTPAQKTMAGCICGRMRKLSKPVSRKKAFSLYAIRLGSQLKIGVTCAIARRLSAFRTSYADVEIAHEIKLGEITPEQAVAREQKLHRYLRRRGHWITRELFSVQALAAVKEFIA